MRKFAVAGLVLVLLAGGLVFGTVAAANAGAASCTGTVQIDSMTWNPPSVTAGQSSTLTVVAQNCTSQPLQTMLLSYARFVDSAGNLPSSCIAYDPFVRPLAIPANGQATATVGYSTFASCTATGLQATATISLSSGGTLASQTSTLPITSPATCAVHYTRASEWQGGMVAQVTITNTGSTTVNGWTLGFTFPGDQKITGAWGATVTQTGAAVSAVNLPYDAVIAPAAGVSFGFQATWQTSDADPAAFQLNKATCTTR